MKKNIKISAALHLASAIAIMAGWFISNNFVFVVLPLQAGALYYLGKHIQGV